MVYHIIALYVAKKPRDEKVRKGRDKELDPGWRWSRKRIGNLLEEGLKDKERPFSENIQNPIPFTLREKSWEILEILTSDHYPTKYDEEEEKRRNFDLSTLSLNRRIRSSSSWGI